MIEVKLNGCVDVSSPQIQIQSATGENAIFSRSSRMQAHCTTDSCLQRGLLKMHKRFRKTLVKMNTMNGNCHILDAFSYYYSLYHSVMSVLLILM